MTEWDRTIFDGDLDALLNVRPPVPISRINALRDLAFAHPEHLNHITEQILRFIETSPPDYRVAGLYLIDAVIRKPKDRQVDTAVIENYRSRFHLAFRDNALQGLFSLCTEDDKARVDKVLTYWGDAKICPKQITDQLKFDMQQEQALSERSEPVVLPNHNATDDALQQMLQAPYTPSLSNAADLAYFLATLQGAASQTGTHQHNSIPSQALRSLSSSFDYQALSHYPPALLHFLQGVQLGAHLPSIALNGATSLLPPASAAPTPYATSDISSVPQQEPYVDMDFEDKPPVKLECVQDEIPSCQVALQQAGQPPSLALSMPISTGQDAASTASFVHIKQEPLGDTGRRAVDQTTPSALQPLPISSEHQPPITLPCHPTLARSIPPPKTPPLPPANSVEADAPPPIQLSVNQNQPLPPQPANVTQHSESSESVKRPRELSPIPNHSCTSRNEAVADQEAQDSSNHKRQRLNDPLQPSSTAKTEPTRQIAVGGSASITTAPSSTVEDHPEQKRSRWDIKKKPVPGPKTPPLRPKTLPQDTGAILSIVEPMQVVSEDWRLDTSALQHMDDTNNEATQYESSQEQTRNARGPDDKNSVSSLARPSPPKTPPRSSPTSSAIPCPKTPPLPFERHAAPVSTSKAFAAVSAPKAVPRPATPPRPTERDRLVPVMATDEQASRTDMKSSNIRNASANRRSRSPSNSSRRRSSDAASSRTDAQNSSFRSDRSEYPRSRHSRSPSASSRRRSSDTTYSRTDTKRSNNRSDRSGRRHSRSPSNCSRHGSSDIASRTETSRRRSSPDRKAKDDSSTRSDKDSDGKANASKEGVTSTIESSAAKERSKEQHHLAVSESREDRRNEQGKTSSAVKEAKRDEKPSTPRESKSAKPSSRAPTSSNRSSSKRSSSEETSKDQRKDDPHSASRSKHSSDKSSGSGSRSLHDSRKSSRDSDRSHSHKEKPRDDDQTHIHHSATASQGTKDRAEERSQADQRYYHRRDASPSKHPDGHYRPGDQHEASPNVSHISQLYSPSAPTHASPLPTLSPFARPGPIADLQLSPGFIRVVTRTMYVGPMPPGVREKEIREIFAGYGDILSVIFNQRPDKKLNAFVQFGNRDSLAAAKEGSKGLRIRGVQVTVNWAHGFGPKSLYNYSTGESILRLKELTSEETALLRAAPVGGFQGSRVRDRVLVEEPGPAGTRPQRQRSISPAEGHRSQQYEYSPVHRSPQYHHQQQYHDGPAPATMWQDTQYHQDSQPPYYSAAYHHGVKHESVGDNVAQPGYAAPYTYYSEPPPPAAAHSYYQQPPPQPYPYPGEQDPQMYYHYHDYYYSQQPSVQHPPPASEPPPPPQSYYGFSDSYR